MRPDTPTLDRVVTPTDLRALSDAELSLLANELRAETISVVSETGGHLGSSLGVVELTVAIHAVFNAPVDKLIWDVGHQCYPHKILTGRRDRMRTLRQGGGLSGFTKRSESEYDPFGAAHSSTSISAALGFAVARDMGQPTGDAIAVIGDGAITAGMAYEAMNAAGHLGQRLFVVLNDNDMSIAPPVGAMSKYLTGLSANTPFAAMRDVAAGFEAALPGPLRDGARRARALVTGMPGGGTLFEELGFTYIGPIDGHDMPTLLATLRAAKARATGPVLIHAVTVKGKGYAPAEAAAHDEGPIAFRYPRGEGVGAEMPARGRVLPMGKGRVVRQGETVALLSFGAHLSECLIAAEVLGAEGISATVADARFAKPLDTDLIGQLARHHRLLITVEQGAMGGFGALVLQHLANSGGLDGRVMVRTMTLPDRFIEQASPAAMYADAGLTARDIALTVQRALGTHSAGEGLRVVTRS